MSGKTSKKKEKAKAAAEGIKVIASNRRAFFDYTVLEQVEAGLVLQGTEVKSLREGQVSFMDAHVRITNDEAWLVDLHIASYKNGGYTNHAPDRSRKLLLRKKEIAKIKQKLERQGLTVIPLELYFRRGFAKVKVGVCRGKKIHDKREDLKQKAERRDRDRE